MNAPELGMKITKGTKAGKPKAKWTCEEVIGKVIYNKEVLNILVPVVHIKTYWDDELVKNE